MPNLKIQGGSTIIKLVLIILCGAAVVCLFAAVACLVAASQEFQLPDIEDVEMVEETT
jgi:hypothetical protein